MGQLNENLSTQKLRGGYYTPDDITDFICRWGIQKNTMSVFEPSCGNGNFIISALNRFKELGIDTNSSMKRVSGIELIEEEALLANKRVHDFGINKNIVSNGDFFHFASKHKNTRFDTIIGNPPFIRYQNFPEEHRKIAIELMHGLNLKPNKLTNIWAPFLVVSSAMLNDNGKLAMVIPAELFQVKYAAETRVFLSEFFERITIIAFEKLVFSNIQQEVVLLLCEKSVTKAKGIRVIEVGDLPDLAKINFTSINGSTIKPIEHTTEKWTKYFLSEKEILLLRNLRADNRIMPCKDIFSTEVGLVTGRNEFFMLNEEQVSQWHLEDYTIPVASKSNHLEGIIFTEKDFLSNSQKQKTTHLFLPPDVDFDKLPKQCKAYIRYGEENGFHNGYKTRIRKRWYITPSRWVPDGFALRQISEYPKIIVNNSCASSTDTIHRVRFKDNVNSNLAAASFLNSLTFAFSEVTGRSYGGGVMTFEPSEIAEIRIPTFDELKLDIKKIDLLIRDNAIEKVLDIVDEALLINYHGFCREDILALRGIWRKLAQRRIKRK